MKNAIQILLTAVLLSGGLRAQTAGYVYGINNSSSGAFYFSKMEVATGTFTQLQLMPWSGYNGLSSSCIDNYSHVFYYCGGQTMYKIDPATGAILSSNGIPNIGTGTLVGICFNPCDSMIYGIVHNSPSTYFARYNPTTGTITNMGALSSSMGFMLGAMSFIDPVNHVYVLHNAGGLLGISTFTGQVVYNTAIIPIANESFGHIAYDCKTGMIYGTSANSQDNLKRFATVDPVTGIVSHVGTASWPTGFWKPGNGGDCIDDSTDIYYYSGAPDLLIGVSITTGDTVSVQSTGAGSFLFIQCFSQCACTDVGQEDFGHSSVSVFPNPANEILTVTLPHGCANSSFVIYDAVGKETMRLYLTVGANTVALEALTKGVYFWSVFSEDQSIQSSGRVIRQ